VVRAIQSARRDAALDVSDRIDLTIGADADVAEAVETHRDFVAAETLATKLTVVPLVEVPDADDQTVGDGGAVRVVVAKA
jgi:isoleucyl-tRNA synthetase